MCRNYTEPRMTLYSSMIIIFFNTYKKTTIVNIVLSIHIYFFHEINYIIDFILEKKMRHRVKMFLDVSKTC